MKRWPVRQDFQDELAELFESARRGRQARNETTRNKRFASWVVLQGGKDWRILLEHVVSTREGVVTDTRALVAFNYEPHGQELRPALQSH